MSSPLEDSIRLYWNDEEAHAQRKTAWYAEKRNGTKDIDLIRKYLQTAILIGEKNYDIDGPNLLLQLEKVVIYIEKEKIENTVIEQIFVFSPKRLIEFIENFTDDIYQKEFTIELGGAQDDPIIFLYDLKEANNTETDVFLQKNMPINGDINHCCYDSYLPIYRLFKNQFSRSKIVLSSLPAEKYIYVITFNYFREYVNATKENGLHFIPAKIWGQLKSNKAILILNDTHESADYTHIFPTYNRILKKQRAKNVFLLSGNLSADEHYQRFCTNKDGFFSSLFTTKEKHFQFYSFRFFEEAIAELKRTFYPEYTAEKRLHILQTHQEKLKHFICLNRIVKDYRVALSYHFFQMGILSKSIISQNSFVNENDYQFGHNSNKELFDDIAPMPFEEFRSSLPWHADTENLKPNLWNGIPIDSLNRSLVWVVTETEFSASVSTAGFISEKTYKPIAFFMPFIIVGNPCLLKTLKKEGYKTFSNWWDESYDDETNPKKRMEKIMQTIQRLAALPIHELLAMNTEMQATLTHNYKNLMERNSGKKAMEAIRNQYNKLG